MSILPIEINDRVYGVDVADVREILVRPELTPVPFSPHWIMGLADVRGEIVPVVSLPDRLGETSASRERIAASPHLLVLEAQNRVRFGILAERVGSVRNVPDNQLTPAQHVCERGRVVVESISMGILNPSAIISNNG